MIKKVKRKNAISPLCADTEESYINELLGNEILIKVMSISFSHKHYNKEDIPKYV